MTETRAPAPQPSPAAEPVSGVRAARIRCGLTQQEVADQLNIALYTYRRWDRGTARPRSPQRQQHLAVVLDTTIDVLFPIEEDVHVAVALRAAEDETPGPGETSDGPASNGVTEECAARASVETEAEDADEPSRGGNRPSVLSGHRAASDGVEVSTQADPSTRSVPEPDALRPRGRDTPAPPAPREVIPSPRDVLATVDRTRRPVVRIPSWLPRAFSPAATAAAIVIVALAILGSSLIGGGERPAATSSTRYDLAAVLRTAVESGVTPSVRNAAKAEQRDREKADQLVEHASGAAERGELELALARLDRVRTTYGMTDAARAVRRRVSVIRERRAERAVERRAAARKRAAAQIRADAHRAPSAGAVASSSGADGSSSVSSGSASNGSASAGSNTGTGNTSSASTAAGPKTNPKPQSSSEYRDPGFF